MSTPVYSYTTRFAVKPGQEPEAIKALRAVTTEHLRAAQWDQDAFDTIMNDPDLTLQVLLEEWGWDLEEIQQGIEFVAESQCDEDLLFNTLAPFVVPGSFVEMYDDHNEHWRWYFDGERAHEQQGRVVYDDPPSP